METGFRNAMKVPNNIRLVALLVAAQIFSGCGQTAKFVYPSNPKNLIKLYDKPKYDLKVAVLPFEEERSDKNSVGGMWLSMIPLVPYGSLHYDRPDAAKMFMSIYGFEFDVSEDLSKAVVSSLKRSNLFKNVYFSYGGDIENADLIIKGTVKSTHYKGTIYSYCISFVSAYLWILGLPAGSSTNELVLEISADSHKSTEPIWEYNLNKEKRIVQGLYYRMGHDVKQYAFLMEEAMNEAAKDLDKTLSSIPISELKK